METVFDKGEPKNASHGVTVGHSQMRHPRQGRTTNQHLRRLPGKLPCAHPFAEDRFQAKHLGLSQAPPMIPDFLLPRFATYLADPPQVLISDQTLLFAVTVLPNPGILLRRDRRFRLPFFERFIAPAFVIGAIAADLLNLALDLLKQIFDDLRVGNIVGRHHRGDNLARRFVGANVQFSPRPTLAVAVLTNFPFAFAKDFDARRIDHQMQGLAFGQARQSHPKPGAAAAQGGVVGCRHFDSKQLDNRKQQPLSGAQRQVIDLFERRHAGDGDVTIGVGLAAFASLFLVKPEGQHFVTNPERQTSTLHESGVILFPIAEAVSAFGVFFLHKSRIPPLSSPYFMQQSRIKLKKWWELCWRLMSRCHMVAGH